MAIKDVFDGVLSFLVYKVRGVVDGLADKFDGVVGDVWGYFVRAVVIVLAVMLAPLVAYWVLLALIVYIVLDFWNDLVVGKTIIGDTLKPVALFFGLAAIVIALIAAAANVLTWGLIGDVLMYPLKWLIKFDWRDHFHYGFSYIEVNVMIGIGYVIVGALIVKKLERNY